MTISNLCFEKLLLLQIENLLYIVFIILFVSIDKDISSIKERKFVKVFIKDFSDIISKTC